MSGEITKSCLICQIIFSIIGVLSGIIGILVLALEWQDEFTSNDRYASLAYAGLSSVLALWNGVLHTMHFQDIWRVWLKGLRLFIFFGAMFTVINIISFLVFIIISAVNHTSMSPDSFYVTAIWCVWGSLWSIMLFYFSKRYRNEYADLTALLDF